MAIYFCAESNGFYDDEMKDFYLAAGSWPENPVTISERWYQQLLSGQSEGKTITANEYGQPVLMPAPSPTIEQIIEIASEKKQTLMVMANAMIAPLQDAKDLDIASDEENAALVAWKKYRVLLNRVDVSTGADITWPEVP